MKKYGYVHIPKCGGSSLNKSIHEALGMQTTHIPSTVSKDTKAWFSNSQLLIHRLACNSIYLSGHLTYTEMKSLNRDIIFSVLRDPKFRLFSLFTYKISKSFNSKLVAVKPKLSMVQSMTFKSFLDETTFFPMSYFLLSNKFNHQEILQLNNELVSGKITRDDAKSLVYESLLVFDFLCSEEHNVLLSLKEQGLIESYCLNRINESNIDLSYDIGLTESDFKARILNNVFLDEIVYEAALELFPETFKGSLVTIEEFVESIKQKYKLIFLK